jgi:membrane associated rhomboid family serine protease
VFPLRDDNPHFLTPVITYALIAANVLAWALLQGLGAEPFLSNSVCRLGLIPAELLQTVTAGTRFQAGPETICVIGDASTWYTPLTSMFMHGGWFHVGGNMLYLGIFGNNVEDTLGHLRYLLFYLASGVAAALAQVVVNPTSDVPMVGASGAVSGVLGAYLLLFPHAHVTTLIILGFFFRVVRVPALIVLGFWIVIQVLNGLGSFGARGGVAFFAHIGGFLAGIALLFVLRPRAGSRAA